MIVSIIEISNHFFANNRVLFSFVPSFCNFATPTPLHCKSFRLLTHFQYLRDAFSIIITIIRYNYGSVCLLASFFCDCSYISIDGSINIVILQATASLCNYLSASFCITYEQHKWGRREGKRLVKHS